MTAYMVIVNQPDSPSRDLRSVPWNNHLYAEPSDAVAVAAEACDRFRELGYSWTVVRVEQMETFR